MTRILSLLAVGLAACSSATTVRAAPGLWTRTLHVQVRGAWIEGTFDRPRVCLKEDELARLAQPDPGQHCKRVAVKQSSNEIELAATCLNPFDIKDVRLTAFFPVREDQPPPATTEGARASGVVSAGAIGHDPARVPARVRFEYHRVGDCPPVADVR